MTQIRGKTKIMPNLPELKIKIFTEVGIEREGDLGEAIENIIIF
jgi:hypothetical protein